MSDIKKSHQGRLHKALHVPEGKPIPLSLEQAALRKAKKNHNVRLEKELIYAINVKK